MAGVVYNHEHYSYTYFKYSETNLNVLKTYGAQAVSEQRQSEDKNIPLLQFFSGQNVGQKAVRILLPITFTD
jgi:hypothetical protein